MMKTTRRIIPLLLLVGSLTAGAEGLRKEGGEAFLEPLQKRDSVLVADQFRYGIELKDVAEGTPLALPEIQTEKDSPLEFVGDWQLDSVKVKKTGLYTIKASRILTAWWGGSYELPDIPVLFGGDTLVFKAPAEPLVVNELPVDMENFQAHDIKDQVKFPYTFKEVAPWVLGALVVIGLITCSSNGCFTEGRPYGKRKTQSPPTSRPCASWTATGATNTGNRTSKSSSIPASRMPCGNTSFPATG